jgi:two-component system sensor histidine kinase HydH
VLAVVAVLVTATSSWLAWQRVRASLVGEFEERLRRVAGTAAGQITGDLVDDARGTGEEGAGYLAVQVQLVTLRAATSVVNASLVDSAGVTLVDVRAPFETEGIASALDSLTGGALARALRGETTVSRPFRHDGRVLRAGFAPVRGPADRVAGVVAIEDEPAYDPVLAELARTLALIVAASAAAVAALAAVFLRAAAASGRLERRLSRAENLAAMGRLTATLAHEIKNPLAIIRGSAERLRSADPEASRMAGFVIEEADRLSRTVARYLQFARGGEEGAEKGDAIAALDSTLDLLEGELRSRRVTLARSHDAPDSVTVRLDPESLKQVYLNLLLNAVEAMPDGGRLGVRDRVASGRLEVEIADEGPGIAPEVLKRIGSPFFTTKARGSGLGLFLTRRLVRSSGGDLEILSEPGRGTTCRVHLPWA